MNKLVRFTAPKRPTNVSLPADLVEEAKQLGINLSQACESGLAKNVQETREAKWLDENRPALLAWNAWIEANGMPYDEYRHF